MVAEYCPEKLDTKRYNWSDYSWAVAIYCPEKLCPDKINWDDPDITESLIKKYAPEWLKEWEGRSNSIERGFAEWLNPNKPDFDWGNSWAVAKYYPEKLDIERYNWQNHSWAVAVYCPEKLDPNRYNWHDYSEMVAKHCPNKLDVNKYNWQDTSWAIAIYCPEKLDADRYNWHDHSDAVAKYCPEKLDVDRYDWKDCSWAIIEYCPNRIDLDKINWNDPQITESLMKKYAPEWLKEYRKQRNIKSLWDEEQLDFSPKRIKF